MNVIYVNQQSTPIKDTGDVLVSEMPLTYLQGIRDAACVDPILIGNNGMEIQKNKNSIPFYSKYKTIDDALKGLEDNEF